MASFGRHGVLRIVSERQGVIGKAEVFKRKRGNYMVYKYEWRYQHFPVKADEAGKEFERIEKENGKVTAENLLDSARPENSVMHDCFEWNDTEAAEKYRLLEAKNVINQLVKVVVKKDSEQPREQRAYVNINPQRGFGIKGDYISIERAMSEEETRKIVLKRALEELSAYKRKYQEFSELSKVFSAIDELGKEFEKGELDES
jgi:hypothetical protein